MRDWEYMTPAELDLYAKTYTERRRAQQKVERAHIYALASLTRSMIWGKHPPSYKETFPEDQGAPKAMTDEAMLAKVKALTLAMGGTVEE